MKEESLKLELLPIELTKEDFNKDTKVNLSMTVDPSAEYATNADEYFRKAMIGENSSRSKFRQVLGIKNIVKLGTAIFDSLIQSGACDFNGTNSTASQKEFRVVELMVGTDICINELEQAFMSDQILKGANNYTDKFAFMNFFYETLSLSIQEELEYLTWQGDTAGSTGGYLDTLDGLEKQLTGDVNVLKPTAGNGGVASAVTTSNIIDKLTQARNIIPKGVKNKSDYVYLLSVNAYEAYVDAISINQASGQYFSGEITPNFQGVEVYKAEGMSDDVIAVGQWSNFLNIQDLLTDQTGFEVIDMLRTNGDRKIRVRTDFKFIPTYIKSDEIYFHKP